MSNTSSLRTLALAALAALVTASAPRLAGAQRLGGWKAKVAAAASAARGRRDSAAAPDTTATRDTAAVVRDGAALAPADSLAPAKPSRMARALAAAERTTGVSRSTMAKAALAATGVGAAGLLVPNDAVGGALDALRQAAQAHRAAGDADAAGQLARFRREVATHAGAMQRGGEERTPAAVLRARRAALTCATRGVGCLPTAP